MVGKILHRSFWIGYDRLGRMVLLNLIWFVLGFAPAVPLAQQIKIWPPLLSLAILFAYLLYLGLLLGGVFHSMMFMEEEPDTSFLRLFFRGVSRGLRVALPLLALDIVVMLLLAYGVNFYLQRVPGLVGKVLAGISLWMAVFWLMGQQYLLPLASMAGCGFVASLKRAFSLALDNFLVSLGLLFFALTLLLLCALPYGVGVMLFVAGGLAALYRAAGELLFLKYDLSFHPGLSLAEMKREEGRGLRDFFRPWE